MATSIILPSVDNLRSSITQILNSIILLEFSENVSDSRSYTTDNVLEALQITERVISERLNDSFSEWKNDDQIPKYKQSKKSSGKKVGNELMPFRLRLGLPYGYIFTSIEEQVKETIESLFSDPNGKTLRFVHTFNTLLLERLFTWLQLIGPSGSRDMIPYIMAEYINHISEFDEEQHMLDLHTVRSNLAVMRSTSIKKMVNVKTQRLDIIRACFERQQDQEAA